MDNVVENVVDQVAQESVEALVDFDLVVAAVEQSTPVEPVAVVEAPVEVVAAPKQDRRKGHRKTMNADGTVSYGLKADGTPRSKPGRHPNPKAATPAV